MKLGSIVAGLALALTYHAAGQPVPPPDAAAAVPKCTSISVRKEIRSLSAAEWAAYNSALQKAVADGWINWFGFLHEKIERVIHGNSMFFLAHRNLMADYEAILRGYDPTVVLPYWNTMLDFQSPPSSLALGDSFFGGNGDAANGGCVPNGIANGWNFTYPKPHCLTRIYGQGMSISSWYPPEFVTSILQTSKTYSEFRKRLEGSLHGIVHLSLGGDIRTMHSPLDPVFWSLHGNIDRLYAQWQAADPDNRDFMYDGTYKDGTNVTLNDPIAYTSVRAYELMRLGYGKLCYTYDTIVNANGNAADLLSKKLDTREGQDGKGSQATTPKCKPRLNPELHGLRSLPKNLLENYFPGVASGNINEMESDMRSLSTLRPPTIDRDAKVDVPVPNEAMRGKLPYPMTLTDDFIEMMYLDSKEVRDLEAHARQMIDDLNKANYLSPYLV